MALGDLVRRRNTGENMTNMPVRITGYDLTGEKPAALGVAVHTGEDVRVYLRPDKNAATRTYPRSEIKDLAAHPRAHKASTEPGGIVRFDGAVLEKAAENGQPATYSARWPTVLSHFENQAVVVTGMARVNPLRTLDDGRKRQSVDIMFPNQAAMATRENFAQMLTAGLDPSQWGVPGHRTVLLRATNDQGEAIALRASGTFTLGQGGAQTLDPPDVAARKFIESEKGQGLLGEWAKDSSVKVEMVPGVTFNLGRDSLAKADSSRSLDQAYHIEGSEKYGYTESVVAIRARENGSFYFTEAKPLEANPQLFLPANIPTTNFAGTGAEPAAAPDDEESFEAPAPAAEQQQTVTQQFQQGVVAPQPQQAPQQQAVEQPAPQPPTAAAFPQPGFGGFTG